MARVLDSRRQTRGMQSLLHKLLGLDAKMRQYEVGEAFVAAVEQRGRPARARPRVARARSGSRPPTS